MWLLKVKNPSFDITYQQNKFTFLKISCKKKYGFNIDHSSSDIYPHFKRTFKFTNYPEKSFLIHMF